MADLDELIRRQRVLAEFGDFVLDHDDLDEILNEACRLVAGALDTDLAKVVEIERETNTGFIRAGVGWRSGIVGHERIDMSERSSEAYAIEIAEPVITNDLSREDRFDFPAFLHDHGVLALVNVPILLPGRKAYGVLQVDAREPRQFDKEDVEFLKTYSMVLGAGCRPPEDGRRTRTGPTGPVGASGAVEPGAGRDGRGVRASRP